MGVSRNQHMGMIPKIAIFEFLILMMFFWPCMYVYVCRCKFFKVNDRSKLKACLQPDSQIKMIS